MSDPFVTLAFYAVAGVTIIAALGVVVLGNIYRAALCLVLTFLGVAGVYVLLNADFIAVVQILIYAGAIATLIIFAVMLTRSPSSSRSNPSNRQSAVALFATLVLLVVLVVTFGMAGNVTAAPAPPASSIDVVAQRLFSNYALPFELASVLLLSAMVGAIVLARED